MQTYNSNVKVVLYNRILLFLAFFGMFDAGVLSLAKIMKVTVPCGGSHGCDLVTNDKSAYFLSIPIAYIGFVAYAALAAFALIRISAGPVLTQRLTLLGYLAAAFGTLTSIALQVYSYTVIGEICKWCFGSAVTMTVTLIVYALLFQAISDLPEDAPRPPSTSFDLLIPGTLGVLLVAGLLGMIPVLKAGERIKGLVLNLAPNYPLVPDSPNIYGDLHAPITIVEFADLNCPSCQQNSPRVKEFVREHEGKVRLVYRHFPLPMHKTSQLAAAIDEYAAEKGKFWEYTMAVMQGHKEIDDPDELYAIASQVNLDVLDLKKRLLNSDDPIYKKLTNDENAAAVIGIQQTPTFIVVMQGVKPKAFNASDLLDALVNPPYKKAMEGM